MSGHEQISEVGEVTISGVSTEAKQDAQIVQLTTIQGKQDTTNTKIDSTNTKLDSTNTKIDSTNTKLDTIDTDIKATQPRTITQKVVVSTSNEKTTNILGNDTWYGLGESTLGVAGIQVNFAASNDCEVEVQQSNDNVNWDVRDLWEVPVTISMGLSLHGRTVQATGSYFRIRVTNLASVPTTYFRLSVALCPIVEALPRALTEKGNIKVCIRENDVGVVHFGGMNRIGTHDIKLYELIQDLIQEVQVSNIHLESISGVHISKKDKHTIRRVS